MTRASGDSAAPGGQGRPRAPSRGRSSRGQVVPPGVSQRRPVEEALGAAAGGARRAARPTIAGRRSHAPIGRRHPILDRSNNRTGTCRSTTRRSNTKWSRNANRTSRELATPTGPPTGKLRELQRPGVALTKMGHGRSAGWPLGCPERFRELVLAHAPRDYVIADSWYDSVALVGTAQPPQTWKEQAILRILACSPPAPLAVGELGAPERGSLSAAALATTAC